MATREREKEEAARKKAAEANTEKWEKKVQGLQGKFKAKRAFIEEQNNIQKTAHAKGEKMKSAEALRQNLRAAELRVGQDDSGEGKQGPQLPARAAC